MAIAANDLQIIAVLTVVVPLAAPRPIDLSPPTGDATPQTHAHAYLSS